MHIRQTKKMKKSNELKKEIIFSFFIGEQWILTIQNNKYFLNPELEISIQKQEYCIQ